MRDLTPSELGERITLLRDQRGLSMSELAAKADLAKSYLSRIEKGEVENPGLKTLSGIAKALGVTVRDILMHGASRKVSGVEEGSVAFQTITDSMPEPLSEFLREQEKKGDRVPPDTARALAVLKLRGKRPESASDYRLLYEMLRRLV